MQAKLTKTLVEKASPKEKDHLIHDTDVSGFALKITPSGRKTFVFQYKHPQTKKTKRITIGQHSDYIEHNGQTLRLSVNVARKKAEIFRGKVIAGQAPMEATSEQKQSISMNDALDEFIKTHIKNRLKPITASQYIAYIEQTVRPLFERRKVEDVCKLDIAKLKQSNITEPCRANHLLALLSKFFNWCEEVGYREDGTNPCRHVKKNRIPPKERFLTKDEFSKLQNTLDNHLENETENIYAIYALKLILLTGARRNEILSMQWEFVDFDNGVINLADSKTGKKTIHLSPDALQILHSIPRTSDNPYVIIGKKPKSHLVNLQKPWARIRQTLGLDDVRIHDFRHTYASFAVSNGTSLHIVGKLLGHKQAQTTHRYAHLQTDSLKAAIFGVAQTMNGEKSQPNT